MKPLALHRKLAALGVAVVLGVLVVGLAGQLPNFGETAPVVFAGALLGVWTVGTLAWRP
jgi:hypothetical protein